MCKMSKGSGAFWRTYSVAYRHEHSNFMLKSEIVLEREGKKRGTVMGCCCWWTD